MRAAGEIPLDNSKLDNSKLKSAGTDMPIMLFYVVVAITVLALIYAASGSSGTAAGDFASMSAFP